MRLFQLVSQRKPVCYFLLFNQCFDQDADEDCKMIGLCSSVEFETYPLMDLVPAKITQNDLAAFRESGPKMTAPVPAECTLCEFVMKEVDDLLEKNSTEVSQNRLETN